MKKNRTRYSRGYEDEALALADRIGVTAAPKEIGIHASQLKLAKGMSPTTTHQQRQRITQLLAKAQHRSSSNGFIITRYVATGITLD